MATNINFSDILYGLSGTPQSGGLSASNYPNPYGLRAYKNNDGSYGGQMMPKGSGWLGLLPNLAHAGSVSSELSTGDDLGDFPSMVPNLTQEQVTRLLRLKDGEKVPKDIYEVARAFANTRRDKNLNTFKDIWDK